ncbi:MAG: hypothetical protein ACI97A_000042 [Planctomycetota bacterium]|jgi:hypothetical protein
MSNIIKASNIGAVVGLPASSSNSTGKRGSHRGNDTSEITLHRNDQDIIEAIEILCSCGQTTFVECVYPSQENAS